MTSAEHSWPVIFGQAVRRHRKERGMTQRALASLAHVSTESVQLLECGGLEFVNEETANRVCDALGIVDAVSYYAWGVRH